MSTSVASSASTWRRYAAAVPCRSVGPEVGQRDSACQRKLAYRVSSPCQNGELELRASSTGSQTRIRSIAPTASSSESTATCTWQAHVSCS